MIKKFIKFLLCFFIVVTMFPTLKKDVSAVDDGLLTITVNYIYEGEIKAREPDISTFSRTAPAPAPFDIIFPNIAGYKPTLKVGENFVDQSKLNINVAEILASPEPTDIDYTVKYVPIDVQYQIRYYKQNIFDDGYSEDATQYVIDQGKTGDQPKDEYFNKEFTGFTKLYHEPDAIAADGSTVFEVYYDRDFHIINFDLDGGYGTVPFYERYETPVNVTTPTKEGFDFLGWDLVTTDTDDDGILDSGDEVVDELPVTLPAYDLKYKALWRAKEIDLSDPDGYRNHYTVVYWKLNPNESTDKNPIYDYWGKDQIDNVKADTIVTTVKQAKDVGTQGLEQWQYYEMDYEIDSNQNLILKDSYTVKGDGTTVINVLYKPQKYTFKFYYARHNPDSNTYKYQVAGYTTPFADDVSIDYTNGGTPLNRLEIMFDRADWGRVDKLPEIKSSLYTTGTDKIDDITYYYFTFQAYFGQNIKDIWPVGIIDPVKQYDGYGSNTSQNYGENAAFSAWNVEFFSKYALNENKTLKGKYLYVDEGILYNIAYKENNYSTPIDFRKFYHENTINFLGFYENAVRTGNHWNRAIKINYYMYVPNSNGDHTYKGDRYKLEDSISIYDNNVDTNTTDKNKINQTPTAINGYSFSSFYVDDKNMKYDSRDRVTEYSIYFYYEKNKYTLAINKNNGEDILTLDDAIEYGANLPLMDASELTPPGNQVDAYEFAGWYTNPELTEDSKIGNSFTMPASDLMIYAKWEKTKKDVMVYPSINDYIKNQNGKPYEDAFSHGSGIEEGKFAQPPKPDPSFDFVGWYFYDPITGLKKRFAYEILPFYDDLKIFAEWTSSNTIPYEIHYIIEDTIVEIADVTTGKTKAGLTKTFNAKSGLQLYEGYRTNYYPTTNSHSVLIQNFADGQPNPNYFEFEYVKKDNVDYTVRYVDAATGKDLGENSPKTKTTTDTAVTETFEQPVPGRTYIPDSMSKSLVLSSDPNKNIITFYCTEVFNKAMYTVIHHIEVDEDSSHNKIYEIYKTDNFVVDLIPDDPNTVTAQTIDIVGYSLAKNGDVLNNDEPMSGNLTTAGLIFNLYYDKNTYPYIVQHLHEDTKAPMHVEAGQQPTERFEGRYLDVIERQAHIYENYQVTGEATQSIEIRVSGDGTEGNPITNVLTFYYKSKQATVTYEIVTDDGGDGGTLSRTQTVIDATNVNTNFGSTATPNQYYMFAGWYKDKECTQRVVTVAGVVELDDKSMYPATIKPRKIEDVTYYARFVRPPGSIAIHRLDALDPNQVFVYDVTWKDPDNTEHLITVTIQGTGSATVAALPYGEYTITQRSEWSWRYIEQIITKDHTSYTTHFDFSGNYNPTKTRWLNGNSDIRHNVRG